MAKALLLPMQGPGSGPRKMNPRASTKDPGELQEDPEAPRASEAQHIK